MARDCAWGIWGKLKAVTSNRERALRLFRSSLLIRTGVEAFRRTSFSLGLHSGRIFVFTNKFFYLVGF